MFLFFLPKNCVFISNCHLFFYFAKFLIFQLFLDFVFHVFFHVLHFFSFLHVWRGPKPKSLGFFWGGRGRVTTPQTRTPLPSKQGSAASQEDTCAVFGDRVALGTASEPVIDSEVLESTAESLTAVLSFKISQVRPQTPTTTEPELSAVGAALARLRLNLAPVFEVVVLFV